jgi:PKD repeat protein
VEVLVRPSRIAVGLASLFLAVLSLFAWTPGASAQAPVVTAPATVQKPEGCVIDFTVTATAMPGETILSLTASPLPAGATFTTNASNTSGTFHWATGINSAGSYQVTFRAIDSQGLEDDAITVISVTASARAPVVTAPFSATVNEGQCLTITVTAVDPDGDPINCFSPNPVVPFGSFTTNAARTSGTFTWCPTFTQAGSYSVTFLACSDACGGTGCGVCASATTTIIVNNVDRPPTVTAPATASVEENTLLTFFVFASDPDGDAMNSFTATSSPPTPGSTFTVNASNTSGTFSWTPSFTAAGVYNVTFTASNALTGTARTAITIGGPDRAPVVTAPATYTFGEGVLGSFTVTASDPDGEAILSLTAASSPPTPGSTFTANAANTSGTFSWTPSFTAAGLYTVTFTASNALSGSAATAVTVGQLHRPPVVTAPSNVTGSEGSMMTFTVSASDPDGEAIVSLTAAGSAIDAGGTFVSNAASTSGTFSWTPSFTQSGGYSVTFAASNALTGTATTNITVAEADPNPVVTAPATVTRPESCVIDFTVTATAPAGLSIASLTASPLPTGATFTANASNTSGTFHWATSFTSAGSYSVTFTAVTNSGATGTAVTNITITNAAFGPVVTAPASMSVNEGQCLTFVVTAADPDGDPINCLSPSPVIPFATFARNASNTSGTFTWCPTFSDAGTYTVTFTACSAICGGTGCEICGSATTTITVLDSCSGPTADAGGPYTGVLGAPVCFDGSGSSDPSGGPLTYEWDFGDGDTGTGAMICHTYTVAGTYNVTLTVTGSCGSDTDVTTVTFQQFCASAFTQGGNKTLRLGSGKPTWCVRIEPVGGCYENSSVLPASIVMRYTGGAVTEIHALSEKTTIGGDANGNGIEEIAACFAKEDLRQLFSGLPAGPNDVQVTIAMSLAGGGSVQAQLVIRVVASGSALAASVVPNPLNPEASLVFTTRTAGRTTAAVYDASGRLVRTLVDESAYPAGRHDVRFDGRDSRGVPLASGIYFYRVTAAEGSAFGRFAILK